MTAITRAPLLSRLKFWQLAAFGLSGWCALYSAALVNWGACRNWVGHTQGGCFAMTMTLAGLATRRHQRPAPKVEEACPLATILSTEEINDLLARTMVRQGFRLEDCHAVEKERGFGVRAINAGRTMVFETARWQEPLIDLEHAQFTEKNRADLMANLAIIVGIGKPDEAASTFVKTHPIRLLLAKELQTMMDAEKREAEMAAAAAAAVSVTSADKSPAKKSRNRLLAWWKRDQKPRSRRKSLRF